MLRSRRARRAVVAVGLGLAALVCTLALVALALAQETPAWWRSVDKHSAATLATAQAVENGVQTLLTENRPPPPPPSLLPSSPAPSNPPASAAPAPTAPVPAPHTWRVALKATDANAWLNARLPRWLENRPDPVLWPKEVEELQVDFRAGRIRVGARLRSASGPDRILAATLAPRLDDRGSLWLTATSVQIGRLAIPADWVLSGEHSVIAAQVPEALRSLPETQSMLRAFAGIEAMMHRAVIRLPDGRRVRLLSLEASDGRLVMTCTTEVQ